VSKLPAAGHDARLGPADLARRVHEWMAAAGVRDSMTGPAVVALDGPSGSGKTMLALAVAARLPGAAVLQLDEVYPGWDGLEAAVLLLVEHIIRPLAGANAIMVPSWDWALDRPGPARPLPALGPPRPPVVLVEGAGAGARAVAPQLAGLIWVEAAEGVRRERALARDGEAYAPHWSRWAHQEAAHFRREGTRDRADLVLDTTDDAGNAIVVRDRGR
jgi:hypothetical protein